MRAIIQSLLGKAGYEILSKDRCSLVPRTSMSQAIHWLREQQISVNTVLDVGASDGRWSRECMDEYPDATYILFEPQPVHSQALDAFVRSSEGRVDVVKKAVGGENGHLSFDVSDPLGGGPATEESKEIMEVELTTIDSAVEQVGSTGPFLLKLDTHGIEKSILDGSVQTLKQCEALIIEAYNYRITDEALLFWELCAYLDQKGLRCVDLVDVLHREYDNSFWQMDLVFIRSSWAGFDHIKYG